MSHSDEAFTWTAEEAEHAHSQSGASNCGATALLNVLFALKVPVPSIDTVEQCVACRPVGVRGGRGFS